MIWDRIKYDWQRLAHRGYLLVWHVLRYDKHPEKHQQIKRLIAVNDIEQGNLAAIHRFAPKVSWQHKSQYPRGFEPHAWYLFKLCRAINAKNIIEFGICEGISTVVLAAAAQAAGGKLYSIDPSNSFADFVAYNIAYYGLTDSFKRIHSDSVAFREDWRRKYNDQPLDLIMVDSQHTYSLKRKEIDLWLPLLRKGGAIVFHDVIHCADNNQAAISDWLKDKKVCWIETDGWLKPDAELFAQVHNDGHRVNLNIDTSRPFRQVPKPEEPPHQEAHFLVPRLPISHQEAAKRGYQYSYEVRTNGNGLGVLVRHY